MQSPRVALKTSMQGYLLKNHDGGKFAVKNNQRYFTSEGFTVFYYETEKKSKAKGHFDLRNVLSIRPSADKGAPAGAIDLEVGAPNGGVAKRMVIAFPAGEEDRSQWLKLWCSAVVPDGVSAVLASYANPQLAAKLNSEYGGTSAVSARRSIFSSNKPKATIVLTPRTAEALRQQNGDDDPRGAPTVPPHDTSGYDTPRDQSFAPGGPPLPKPEGTPPQPSQTKEDEEDVVTFEITVPDNVQPGDKLQATTPSGVRVKLSAPEGAEPGTILTYALPGAVGGADRKAKAAVLLQARARGAKTRAELAAAASAKTPEDEEIELGLAAIKLQKNFRGHSVRTRLRVWRPRKAMRAVPIQVLRPLGQCHADVPVLRDARRRHALVGPHEQVRGRGRRAEERRTVALQGSQCRLACRIMTHGGHCGIGSDELLP